MTASGTALNWKPGTSFTIFDDSDPLHPLLSSSEPEPESVLPRHLAESEFASSKAFASSTLADRLPMMPPHSASSKISQVPAHDTTKNGTEQIQALFERASISDDKHSAGVALPFVTRDISQSMKPRPTTNLPGNGNSFGIASAPTDVSEVARLKSELQRIKANLAKVKQELHQSAMIQQNNDLARASPPASTVDSDLVTDENVGPHQAASDSPGSRGRFAETFFGENVSHRARSRGTVAPRSRDHGSRSSYEYSPMTVSSHHGWETKTGAWTVSNSMHAGIQPSHRSPSHYRRYGGVRGDACGDARGDFADIRGDVREDARRDVRGDFRSDFRGDLRGGIRSDSRGDYRGEFRGDFVETSRGFPAKNEPRLGDTGDFRRGSNNYRIGAFYDPSVNSWPAAPSNKLESPPSFSPPMTPMPFPPMSTMQGLTTYHPRPIGTGLSPTALEFSASTMSNSTRSTVNPWNSNSQTENTSTYMATTEPMNYRRLLDRNMNCNWKYIVDKIVCNNDQQASIFLQQKLKVSTPEQKFELVEAIAAQAYPLMINRFGNFLIQRCFEHGTPNQVITIADAIRGNTLNLSMDAFGCHVVQKAFDAVPEEYKAIMVHELLRRIPETVIHRYACHVWQKLLELRWSDSPPQIMKYVNEALRGMWHEVALGETGSLVVQNIFENCLEEDKRPCISEVLANIDIISHGQFGNWCIQHICEQGAPEDKSRAVEHVLHFATEYSTDQFASKVVEKCLKAGGSDFLNRYLAKVCEARPDRPRMPLIDIAGDQYGNYLVQYILVNASLHHHDIVTNHIKKHMVSLRGSKFGSRVAMLCTNSSFGIRPGSAATSVMGSRYAPTSSMNRNGSVGASYH